MAAPKFINFVSGVLKQFAAKQTGGTGSEDSIVSTDSSGKIDVSFFPAGIGADTQVVVASENLAAGDFVNYHDVAGVTKARKADASSANAGKRADGFVLAAVTSGQNATVYNSGANTAVTGLTPGPVYLSGSTAGGATSTVASTSGHISQRIGYAISATNIEADIEEPVILA